MTYVNLDLEDALEQETIALFTELGWEVLNAYDEVFDPQAATATQPYLGREHRGQVLLLPRLRAALESLNPDLPAEALYLAIEQLTRDRSAMSLAAANRDVYQLLKDGVKVTYRDPEGEERVDTVRVIDWSQPDNNDFLLVSQLWVTGDMYTRRPDLAGFVNGLPLLFVELKASHRRLVNAYRVRQFALPLSSFSTNACLRLTHKTFSPRSARPSTSTSTSRTLRRAGASMRCQWRDNVHYAKVCLTAGASPPPSTPPPDGAGQSKVE